MTQLSEKLSATLLQERRLRPHERVREYLEKEFLDLPNGTRLPTAQEIAEQLDVGLSTVQKIIRKLSDENHLQTVPGSGTYVINEKSAPAQATIEVIVFFGAIEDHAVEIWQNRISGAIMHEAGNSTSPIRIRPLRRFHDKPTTLATVIQALNSASGIIIFPNALFDEIAQLAAQRGIPFVSLHPHMEEMTENFVSTDYIDICRRSGEAWIACGRQRLALLQAHPSGHSPSNFLRAAGMLDAIGERLGYGVDLRIIDSINATESAGSDAAERLFQKERYNPDAVFCMGDLIAHGFMEWLTENHISYPEKVSIISGTGMQYLNNPIPNPFPGITASRQPLDQIGEELLKMLLRRLQSGVSQPGLYLKASFIGGASTTEKENALLMK